MSNTVIKVEHLTKKYDLGVINTGTLAKDLNRWWARLRGKPDPTLKIGQQDHGNRKGESILALDDVSFTVQQGEVLGIIGPNGAGKSTLLKILSQVTAPTSGVVKVKGRIGSLLEVGTGFHPELTGRENIYLNGAILGMTRQEVDLKFDEIVDFSGVEKFIDTPVKRYSSGMYVRLAFAVSAHLDPEILIVDEVLAVGDIEFQKKCLGKMGDVANAGRTVIFVSHNMATINSLCERVILLEQGKKALVGNPTEITNSYLSKSNNIQSEVIWSDESEAPGTNNVILKSVAIKSEGKLISEVQSDKELTLEISFYNYKPDAEYVIEFKLKDSTGIIILESFNTPEASINTDPLAQAPLEIGLYKSKCIIPANFLNELKYYISVTIVSMNPIYAEIKASDIISFDVIDSGKMRTPGLSGKWFGKIRTPLEWNTEIIDHK